MTPQHNNSVVFALLAALPLFLAACDGKPKEQHAIPPIAVTFVSITPEPVSNFITLTGRTASPVASEVRPQVSGILQKRLFVEGSYVQENEVLYQIDPSLYQAAYDSARATLQKAEAYYETARMQYERFSSAVKYNGVSRQDYDNAKAAHGQAKADVAAAKAAVENARINLGYTKITSPVAGRIGISSVTEGALVTAGQPNPLTSVQKIDPIYVDVTQSSAEFLRLRKSVTAGNLSYVEDTSPMVSIELEDGSEYSRRGVDGEPEAVKGTLLMRDITVNEGTGTYLIRIQVDNPDGLLMPGMYVKATLLEGVNRKGVRVPQQALLRDFKSRPFVYVINNENKAETRYVEVAGSQFNLWVINSGLNAGDKVIVEGTSKVRPGAVVSSSLYDPEKVKSQIPDQGGVGNGQNNGQSKNKNGQGEAAPKASPEATGGGNPAKDDQAKGNK